MYDGADQISGKACRRGSLEIVIKPENGSSSSRIRKIAPDTERAQMNKEASVVPFGCARTAKPANKTSNQKNKTVRNGIGIVLPRWENRRNRACAVSVVT